MDLANQIIDIVFLITYVVLLVCLNIDKHKLSPSQRLFNHIVIMVFIHTTIDLIFCLLKGVKGIPTIQYIVTDSLLIMYNICTFGLLFYLFKSVDPELKDKKNRIAIKLFSIIFLICSLLTIVLSITDDLFYYKDGEYIRGDYIFLSQLFSILVFVSAFIMLFVAKRNLKIRFAYLVFCLTPLVGSIIMIFINDVSLSSVHMFLSIIVIYSNIYIENNRKLYEQDLELMNKKMDLMISQIQPHFLYNTITTAMALCDTDPKQAKKTIGNFGKYLRTNLNCLKIKTPVPFIDELRHIQVYVGLEKQRFLDKLEVEYDIRVSNFELPILSVQPLVENAIKHGITPKVDGGKVVISTFDDFHNNYIVVEDNGVGFDYTKENEEIHIGLNNITKRVENFVNGKIKIESEKGIGTKVTITIPKKKGK